MLFPRYLTYPSIKKWDVGPSSDLWLESLQNSLQGETGWGAYFHVPFCRALCDFCGCNTTITNDDELVREYLKNLLGEWKFYRDHISFASNQLVSLQLGGGTPNFLNSNQLQDWLENWLADVDLSDQWMGAVELDPRHLNQEQISVFQKLKFRVFQLGVQDLCIDTQKKIRREVDFSHLEFLVEEIKSVSSSIVSFDLLFGLAAQTLPSIENSIENMMELSPDRVQLYEWIPPFRAKSAEPLSPKDIESRKAQYHFLQERLVEQGYHQLGYLLFVKKEDPLFLAYSQNQLERKFSGYSNGRFETLLGLGVSAISETRDMYLQNEKALPVYMRKIKNTGFAGFRGMSLSQEQVEVKRSVYELGRSLKLIDARDKFSSESISSLIDQGLVKETQNELVLTKKGRSQVDLIASHFERKKL